MKRFFVLMFAVVVTVFAVILDATAQRRTFLVKGQSLSRPTVSPGVRHIIWVWFENKETTSITAASAPFFTSFAGANVSVTNFFGVTHPSQPNYLDAFSGSTQGITGQSCQTDGRRR